MAVSRLPIKVCGLTCKEDVDVINECGFALAGFIFADKSPRNVQPKQVAAFKTSGAGRVGVFAGQSVQEVSAIMEYARLDFLQLHGDEDVDFCRSLPSEKIIKVFWPQRYPDRDSFLRDCDRFASCSSFFLLDAGQAGGGSGQRLNLEKLAGCDIPRPWLLAGGITSEMVRNFDGALFPRMCGFDMNSGVELVPGAKDHDLLRRIKHNEHTVVVPDQTLRKLILNI